MIKSASANRCNSNNFPCPEEITSCKTYVKSVASTLSKLEFDLIERLVDILWNAYLEDRSVYIFGNGGSAALASHCACDLAKGTRMNGERRFRVLAITDNVPLITAWANDVNYDQVFAEQLRTFFQAGDIAFAISGSGNSPNVINAVRTATGLGGITLGLTGFEGGKLKPLCQLCLVIPSDNMQVIEDAHLAVSHSIFSVLRERIRRSVSEVLEQTVTMSGRPK